MNFNYQGIQIADISTWQDSPLIAGHVDFAKMRDWGFSAVVIRAGHGIYEDVDFDLSWQNAKGILPRATYWYYENIHPPKAQARKYWDTIKGDREGLCFVDLEDRDNGVYEGWRHWYDFIEEFRLVSQLPVEQIGVYTGHYYFEEYSMSATDMQRSYFRSFPLWLAAYPQDPFNPNYGDIRCPRPWPTCLLLQSGTPAIGKAAGVESEELDYNQLNGGPEVFAKYFGSMPTPEPEPDEEPMATYKVLQAINIRNAANFTATVIGQLQKDDIIEVVTPAVNGLFRITKITRAGVNISLPSVTSSWCSAGASYVAPIEEPPIPAPSLPAYFTAHAADGTELGRYNKQ